MTQAELMEKVLAYWRETDAFAQSIASRPANLPFKFYDGPPFTSGDPHYGHLLQSTVKDMIPRRMTMRGYRVERKWGWDCHGIPAENFVNKELGITSRKQVEEEFGIGPYVEACRKMVGNVNDNWKRFIDHVGRWVDMDNAYFTMSNEFMESVIAVFADLYQNNLIYKGFKVLGYSRALGTSLSNSEIAEGYEDRQDPAVTIKLRIRAGQDWFALHDLPSDAKVALLAWTTTPWTLPSNMFAAVHQEIQYALVLDTSDNEYYILAASLLGNYYKDEGDRTIITQFAGEELIGLMYEPLFDCYYHAASIDPIYHEQVHRVLHADFVTEDSGTGIAHEAPAFGEDDYNLVASVLPRDNPTAWLFAPVDDNGEFTSDVPEFAGLNVFAANKEVLKNLKERGLVAKLETITHSYPHCPRTGEPLIYRALESWFVKENELKAKTVAAAEKICFVPASVKHRFIETLKSAPDWNISRTRFRGAPLPVRECKACGERVVCGNIAEIEQRSGQQVTDLHRPYIDEITFPCACGEKMHRIPEVLDCWFESGSMPYGQDHWMKNTWTQQSGTIRLVDSLPQERWQEFKAIRLEAIEKEPAAFGPMEKYHHEESQTDEQWKERLAAGYSVFLEDSGQLVGIMRASPLRDDPTIGGIFSVYIRQEYRGKGRGKMMFDRCVRWLAAQQGVEKLQVKVAKTQETARAVYEKRGFKIQQEVEEDVFGTIIPEYLLELSLEEARAHADFFSPCADFIAEGLDQTRGWFRTLHVLGHAYMDTNVFQNVAVTGMILAEDGKKMSKSKKNYPDPRGLLEQYGADAFRLYLLSSPVVRAEPLRFSEKGVEQILKDFVIPLQNVWNFFETYAKVDGWKAAGTEIYFMRHAEKDHTLSDQMDDRELPLNEAGKTYLQSAALRDQILSVRPEVIISSPYVRCTQTAQGVQDILKTYMTNSVDVIEDERLAIGNDNIAYLREEYQQKYAGKRVLLVAHRQTIEPLWQHLLGQPPKSMGYGEMVKLPAVRIHNELDQWILAELHQTLLDLDHVLAGYEIDVATKTMVGFIDKLTNRYVRRSRRRFRSEGMDEDKQSAYTTLWEVLSTYLKIAAPFAPFVSEYLRQEMGVFQGHSRSGSLHLEYRPLASQLYIDHALIDEITTVRKIIKGAMYLRAKNKIKVKQPLQKMEVRI